MWVSNDAETWTRAEGQAPSFVAAGAQRLIGALIDEESSGDEPWIHFVTSTDGLDWTRVSERFRMDLRGVAVAADGSALAVGAVPGPPRADGTTTTDMVVWRSIDGTAWTGPATIAHDALPLGVVAAGGAFHVLVQVSALLPSGSISSVSHVLRLVDGVEPHDARLPLGDEDALEAIHAAGAAIVATGFGTRPDGGSAAMVWVSTDGGATWNRVVDQKALEGVDVQPVAMILARTGLLAVGRRWDPASGHPLPQAWLVEP